MMGKTNIDWIQLSDAGIVKQIGKYLRYTRQQQNKTQAQMAAMAGLNRWTISQIENGESITLTSLIQILRALDSVYVLHAFKVPDEISPLEYAKLKKKQKERVRNKTTQKPNEDDLGW
ncbi:MAG: helix-turn-helix transcriptional regulator [Bacteroidota bacterium]